MTKYFINNLLIYQKYIKGVSSKRNSEGCFMDLEVIKFFVFFYIFFLNDAGFKIYNQSI